MDASKVASLTPAEHHRRIRPSPSAGPSGMQAKREALHEKLMKINALRTELGMPTCYVELI